MNSILDLCLVLALAAALNPHVLGQSPAEVGSAIVGIVTPDEVLLFTDSASSTIAPVAGANSQLVDEKTTKFWKTDRLIWAQAGLQAMTIHSKSFDFDDPARLLLTADGPFNPEGFRKAWLPEVERPLTDAYNENVVGFTNLVNNGVKGVEIVVGWFDVSKKPHLIINQKGGSTSPSDWRTRTFTYDMLGRALTAVTPEAGTSAYTYPSGSGSCAGALTLVCTRTDANSSQPCFRMTV